MAPPLAAAVVSNSKPTNNNRATAQTKLTHSTKAAIEAKRQAAEVLLRQRKAGSTHASSLLPERNLNVQAPLVKHPSVKDELHIDLADDAAFEKRIKSVPHLRATAAKIQTLTANVSGDTVSTFGSASLAAATRTADLKDEIVDSVDRTKPKSNPAIRPLALTVVAQQGSADPQPKQVSLQQRQARVRLLCNIKEPLPVPISSEVASAFVEWVGNKSLRALLDLSVEQAQSLTPVALDLATLHQILGACKRKVSSLPL
jgi:hypothetical protein